MRGELSVSEVRRKLIKIGLVLAVLSLAGLLVQETWANPAHDRLQQMSLGERNTFFTKFLQGSGESCDVVTKNFFQGAGKSGDAIWNVACRNDKAFSILIHNDAEGSTKVISCAMLKALNAGECFKKF